MPQNISKTKKKKQIQANSNKNLLYYPEARLFALFLLIIVLLLPFDVKNSLKTESDVIIQITEEGTNEVNNYPNVVDKKDEILAEAEIFYPNFHSNTSLETRSIFDIRQDNQLRLTHLQNICSDTSSDPNLFYPIPKSNEEISLRRYFLSNTTDEFRLIQENAHRYLLCEIPKAGTTNWKKIVLQGQYPEIYGQKSLKDIIRPHSQLYGENGSVFV